MQDFKGSLKRMEFPSQTPQRIGQQNLTDFQSAQKLKYEPQQNMSSRTQLMQNQSYIPKENSTIVSKELYEASIPVKIKSMEREDWQTLLIFKIILNQSSQAHGQILHIELTDESNYHFLQVLDLSEGDFLTLKNEQSLHVDFASFPHKLCDILQLCINSQKDERVSFFINVEIRQSGECIFSVVENNEFKRLTHLSLKFKGATDDILKNYLSQKLSKQIVDNEDLKLRNKKLEDGLQEKIWETDQQRSDLRRFQEDRDATVQSLLLQEQKKLNDIREEALFKESNFVREMENEKRIMVDKYEKIMFEQQSKNSKLLESNQDILEMKNHLEASERDLSSKLKVTEKELQMLQKETSSFRTDNKSLDTLRFSQEKTITELTITVTSLEKQLQDKLSLLDNKKELIGNTNKQNELLSEQIATQKKQIEKLDNKVNQCTEEINKGNQIIEKLQSDIGKQKEKIKLKNQVVLQQESTVQQLQDQSDHQNKQLNEIRREKDNMDIKVKDLEITNNDLKSKIQESQKLIESNNQMIQYLNKCLNDQKVAPVTMQPLSNTYKSTTYNKYVSPTPTSNVDDLKDKQKTFQNTTQPNQNYSQLSNTTQLTNRFNF